MAKRRALDHLRRVQSIDEKHQEMGRELEVAGTAEEPDVEAWLEPVEDDMLRLVFMCCHPVLSREARVALTLRLLGGLTTEEIARAFLVPVPTPAQRIVRAKRTLREAQIPFEMPPEDELGERLASVLEVVYLVFNEGYADTSGEDWIQPELCRDALRLGRILAALKRAQELGGALGPYALQAAIAACHARARTAEDTDWEAIAALYDALAQLAPSPVVAVNRAVAVGMAFGGEAGLELLAALEDEKKLDGYPLLPAVRAHLLQEAGRTEEARSEFLRAVSLTRNEREREVLLRRAR